MCRAPTPLLPDVSADLRPAATVFLGGVAAILAGDIWLMASDRQPVTAWLRTRTGRTCLALLGLHVADVLGPADPFRGVAAVAGMVKGRL